MGELYLCSRTDVLRMIDLDTGRSVGIIGAPEDFLKWMDKLLPLDSLISPGTGALKGKYLDVVIGWFEKRLPERSEIEELREGIKDTGDVWVVVPIHLADGLYEAVSLQDQSSRDKVLTLTPRHVLMPVIRNPQKSRRLD